MLAVAVQPFAAVTVTVYTPGVDTTFVVPVVAPVHTYVTPAVVEDAVNVTLVLVQVNGPSFTAAAFGTAISCVTVVLAVVVQPFAAVIVTVYVPGVVTTFVAPVLPAHAYVTPGVVELAVNVTLVFEQVNGPSFVALAFGVVVF